MKISGFLQMVAFSLLFGGFSAVSAQTENPPTNPPQTRERVANTENNANENKQSESSNANQATDDAQEVIGYYSNYLKEYRLGPNDVISIEVFGQCPEYCIVNKLIPPTARISYPLIRDGVFVGGKTVEQVAREVEKLLDEYIIDPKVTVTLEKAMSARYSVMGKVVQPGIRIMDRRVSLFEAIIEAGGITKEGDKKRVSIISFDAQGNLSRRDVNLAEIEKGSAPMVFLNPGDQVFVGGKGFTVDKVFDLLGKVSIVRLLFGSPF